MTKFFASHTTESIYRQSYKCESKTAFLERKRTLWGKGEDAGF